MPVQVFFPGPGDDAPSAFSAELRRFLSALPKRGVQKIAVTGQSSTEAAGVYLNGRGQALIVEHPLTHPILDLAAWRAPDVVVKMAREDGVPAFPIPRGLHKPAVLVREIWNFSRDVHWAGEIGLLPETILRPPSRCAGWISQRLGAVIGRAGSSSNPAKKRLASVIIPCATPKSASRPS